MDLRVAGYSSDGNHIPTKLRQYPIGDEIPSADTNLHQLVKSGTNTGTRTASTFELTGIDTSNVVDYTEWILEINTDGYRRSRY